MALYITYPRRKTVPCRVGPVIIGGGHPVLVQSMITEETRNIDACVEQIIALHREGCELVRVTTPTLGEARAMEEIRAKVTERYKYVTYADDPIEQLYDMRSDPGETRNLAESLGSVVREHRKLLRGWESRLETAAENPHAEWWRKL